MLVDLLFLSPPWTITILPSLGLSGTIAFGYWFWVERCFKYNGWYVDRMPHARGRANESQVPVSDLRSPAYPRSSGALLSQCGRNGPEYSHFEVAIRPCERLRCCCSNSIPTRRHQEEGGSIVVSGGLKPGGGGLSSFLVRCPDTPRWGFSEASQLCLDATFLQSATFVSRLPDRISCE